MGMSPTLWTGLYNPSRLWIGSIGAGIDYSEKTCPLVAPCPADHNMIAASDCLERRRVPIAHANHGENSGRYFGKQNAPIPAFV